jgi:hypothetical protein
VFPTATFPARASRVNPGPAFRHFARRFRETYGLDYPLDGTACPWPASTGWGRRGAKLPTSAANLTALGALMARGYDLREVRARIDRMFAHPWHVDAGIDLARVARWWPTLARSERFDGRTCAVAGVA